MTRKILAALALYLLVLWPLWAAAQATPRPAIRTITAFVRLDRQHHVAQLGEAAAQLQAARSQFTRAGWLVQSVRITTQPFPDYVRGLPASQAVDFLRQLDTLAVAGGYGLNIGMAMRSDRDDPAMVDVLAAFLPGAQMTNASVHMVADDGSGPQIQWRVIDKSVGLIQRLKDNSPGSSANFAFAATALVEPYAPFYPASWHDGPGRRFSIGLQSASVAAEVLTRTGFNPERAVEELRAELAFHGRQVERLAEQFSDAAHWTYMGLDPTGATYADQASIGAAMEAFTGTTLGASGSLTAAAVITAAVRTVPVKQVGLRGLMLPVLEDARIASRWGEGRLSLDALLSYSSVCGTGLDAVPLPGTVTDAQLKRMLGDVATLSRKWQKGLTARLLPVKGLAAGERTRFNNPFLVDTILQPVP